MDTQILKGNHQIPSQSEKKIGIIRFEQINVSAIFASYRHLNLQSNDPYPITEPMLISSLHL